jgi:DNA damage-binding protein 1
MMKSVCILELTSPTSSSTSTSTPSSSGWLLTEVARHYASVWSSAVTVISQNEWLLADMEGNILILHRNINGVTPDDRKRLEVVGEMRLGEVVNKIIPIGSVSSSAAAMPFKARRRTRTDSVIKMDAVEETEGEDTPPVMPKAFLATVEGGVYMFGSIADSYVSPLLKLQNALAEKVQAPGYMPWAKWRALRNEVREAEEPFRVVDGELVEEVLRLDDGRLQAAVAEGDIGWSVDRTKVVVEGLRRLY